MTVPPFPGVPGERGLSWPRLGDVISSNVFSLSRNLASREQDLEKGRAEVLVQPAAWGCPSGSSFCTENRRFGSFPSPRPWDSMSHITPSLQLIFNPYFPGHPPSCPVASHPSHGGTQGVSACPVTHPALGRSSPRGQGGTGGCQARRGGAGQTRRAAGWPCRIAGAGAAALRSLRGPPRKRGFRCPGRCCGRGEEGVRGGGLHRGGGVGFLL